MPATELKRSLYRTTRYMEMITPRNTITNILIGIMYLNIFSIQMND